MSKKDVKKANTEVEVNLTAEEKARIIAIVEKYLEIYDEKAEKEQWFNIIKELAGEFRIC